MADVVSLYRTRSKRLSGLLDLMQLEVHIGSHVRHTESHLDVRNDVLVDSLKACGEINGGYLAVENCNPEKRVSLRIDGQS